MILKKVRVQNYRCVKDSDEFRIDESVTCLVGKNESGKTAILQSLNKLNPVIAEHAEFDDLDYPVKDWTDYSTRKDPTPAECLTTTWTLDADDIATLRSTFGDAIDYAAEVVVRKGYSNKRVWSVAIDEPKLISHLLTEHGLLQDEREQIGDSQTLASLVQNLGKVESPTDRQKKLLEFVQKEFGKDAAGTKVQAILDARLPKFVYFADYLRLPGQVSIDDLKVRAPGKDPIKGKDPNKKMRDSDRAFLAYLALIDANWEDLENETEFERLVRRLEAASNHLTDKMKKYWSQNRHLRVQVRFETGLSGDDPPFNTGKVMRTRIENLRHGVSTSFDERSAGFVWFFSFLVWFSQVRKEYGDNVVILLDEPGLSLHAKAQHDLLRYIDVELAAYQVLYTTHSPFLVDPEHLLRARTVEDIYEVANEENGLSEDKELGTKVGDRVLSTDRDTVFPLQACLGYEITQTLFVGKHSLLVEGPSEVLYLTWFRQKLASVGRPTLDRRWTLTPCGGITKVAAFLSLFGSSKLHLAVLTDYAKKEKTKVEELRRSKLLRDGHVLTVDDYAGKPEADIEDLIGNASYLDLVNRALGLAGTTCIGLPPTADGRIAKWVEKQAAGLPMGVREFDHFLPSSFLVEQGVTFKLVDEADALARFERLFADLNSLLAS